MKTLRNTIGCYTNVNTNIENTKKYNDILYKYEQHHWKMLTSAIKYYAHINKTIEHIKKYYDILWNTVHIWTQPLATAALTIALVSLLT